MQDFTDLSKFGEKWSVFVLANEHSSGESVHLTVIAVRAAGSIFVWQPNRLVDLLNPAAVDLARANDVEGERRERGQVAMRQHEDDVVEAQRLPVV
jgi:hypothetical protein